MEIKGNQTKRESVGPHSAIDDKIVEFKMLLSELLIAKRKEEVEEIREVLSLHCEDAVNHRPKR